MLRISLSILLSLTLIIAACGKRPVTNSGSAGSNLTSSPLVNANGTLPVVTGSNVLPVAVSGSYLNEPTTSVTICAPGSTTNCQVINNLLVDTGSYGLRIFSSAISAPVLAGLSAQTNGGGQILAECALFGTGSMWGQVMLASVTLGTESPQTMPIQTVNSAYATVPAVCGTPDTQSTAGFNGILGVGLLSQDCGTYCTTTATNNTYFGCTGSTCTSSLATLSQQVINPVSLMVTDNNGVVMEMPTVAFTGNTTTSGYLILGIGTQSNNTPLSSVKTYTANASTAEFEVVIAGQPLLGFIDSGSNGLFLPNSTAYPGCTGAYSSWFCPSSSVTATGQTIGVNSVTGAFTYQIGNAITLFGYSQLSLMNLGGGISNLADLGLPFFFGRTVYVGINTRVSTLATGPYWAY